MKKIFKNIEVLNIVAYINQMPKEVADELPLKFRWNLKKNMDKLTPIAAAYENFRDEQIRELQTKWFDDEHSEEIAQTKIGADGKPEVDEDGNEVTEPARKIKDEFMDDYRKEVSEINSKLNEISYEDNEVDIFAMDLDDLIDTLPEDSKLSFDDITMLSFMDYTTNVKEEAE